MENLSEDRIIKDRIEKLEKIKNLNIDPYPSRWDSERKLIGDDFIEIFVNTPIDECIKRDPKGLYKKALNGEIKGFTGIDAPYENPQNAEIEIKDMTIDESVNFILSELNI